VINFTIEFSKTTSYNFVNDILLDKLNAKIIVVGFNHHFGHNREGDYEYLYELSKNKDFTVEEIPQQDIENEAVSSTRIRKALKNGNIQRANAYLDNHFIMSGKLNYPYNLSDNNNLSAAQFITEEDVKLIPPEGVYAVSIEINDTLYKSMLLIGEEKNEKKIFIPDIYKKINVEDEFCKIYFQKRIRCGNVLLDKNLNNTLKKDKEKISELIF
jgi:riboflavin kinase/FMN adenylyltransferase